MVKSLGGLFDITALIASKLVVCKTLTVRQSSEW